MPAPAYSSTLIRASGAGPFTYVVPAGYRAVVRDMNFVTGLTNPSEVAAYVVGHAYFYRDFLNPGGDISYLHWQGRVVVNDGESLVVTLSAGPVDCYVCGYLLSSV